MGQSERRHSRRPDKAKAVRYLRHVEEIPQLSDQERAALRLVAERYAFRANSYYLSLVDWNDPADPLRRLIVPHADELAGGGRLDPSNEQAVTVAPGVQHKYPHTALLLCSEVCGGLCRYCFRKRLFMPDTGGARTDLAAGLRYIAAHPQITNVLLTGGDPLLLSTRRLRDLLAALRAIPHVRVIRIGSKLPAFDPARLLHDAELHDVLSTYSTPQRRIYLMTHFDHPRELTDTAVAAVDRAIRCGVICANQCPLLCGINDDPAVLAELYRKLSWIGCPPYYLFQCRPTVGNEPYSVPIVRGWFIFREALRHGSGLARRARFVMSHESGKIEILAVDDERIYVRYHRAKESANRGQFMVYERNDRAHWLDDLQPATSFDAVRAAAGWAGSALECPE